MFVPTRIFFTKGVGVHKDRLASFELALRKAGVEKCNLVYVSTNFSPKCKQISKSEGLKCLQLGGITFCVMARNETNEPNRLVSAAIGLALPSDSDEYGTCLSTTPLVKPRKRPANMPKTLQQPCLQQPLALNLM